MNNNKLNDNFVLHPTDVEILDASGKVISKDKVKDYLKEQRLERMTISEKVEIGAQVKTKDDDYIYTIVELNSFGFDYLGVIGNNYDDIYMFNQEDIEKIISRNRIR